MQSRKLDDEPTFEEPRASGVRRARSSERKTVAVAVRFHKDDGTVCSGSTANLSIAGAFIETPYAAAFGTRLIVIMALPGFPAGAEVEATVRWTSHTGMGVQFGLMGARITHALTEIMRR